MGDHIVGGQFKSDKYAWSPPGFVPLKLTDPMAHRPLWDYAQARRAVDAEFADDLEAMLAAQGFKPPLFEVTVNANRPPPPPVDTDNTRGGAAGPRSVGVAILGVIAAAGFVAIVLWFRS